MREFLKGLDLDQETIDTIMAEHGKIVTRDKEEIQNLKSQVADLKQNSDGAEWKSKFEELQTSIKEQEAKKKAEEEDKVLTDNINSLFEGKTFTSDYARAGLLNDIKTELGKPENKGRGIQDLFEELTKDKTDIFTNPNQLTDMAGMGDSEQDNNIKEMPLIW